MIIFKQKVTAFTSSNIPEEIDIDGIPTTIIDWTDLTEYTVGDIRRDGNWYFKCGRNIVATESRPSPSLDKAVWARYAVSNRYAMLDDRSNTVTTATATTIDVKFENTDRFDAIALGRVKASNITIEMIGYDDITVEYTISKDIVEFGEEMEANLYSYYYAPLSDADSRYDFYIALPPAGKTIRVILAESIFGGAECSYLVAGNSIFCGEALAEQSFSFEDNSLKEKDAFGITNLKNRYAQETSNIDTIIDTAYFLALKRKMKTMYGTPIAIAIDESLNTNYENLLSLGYLDNFTEILKDTNKKSRCSLSFTELA